jgi:hypothetical protein
MGPFAPTTRSKPRSLSRSVDSRPSGLVARYREDHRHPINHFLHVGVGWPLAAVAVILLPFRPFWSLGLFVAAYVIMFFGHFAFERNIPTILKHPSTPFVMAYAVVRDLCRALVRLAIPSRARSPK